MKATLTLLYILLLLHASNAFSEEFYAELSTGLAGVEFSDTSRTKQTAALSFSKPLGDLAEVSIGFSDLGHYSLVDDKLSSTDNSNVELRAAHFLLSKGLVLPQNLVFEAGIGVLRWKKQVTNTNANTSYSRADNDLLIRATLLYTLNKNTKLGFMYSEANTDFAKIRSITCNLKYMIDM